MEFDEEYKQFLQNLQQFPNYFQMGTERISSNHWKKLIRKINDEREELLKSSDLDRIKNQNLEACAMYCLGDVDKARTILSKVLEDTKSSSINACAMMAIICYRNGEITRAKRLLEGIQTLGDDPFNIDVAKSELAYAFTRLDATYYMKAIQCYLEAVERNPDNFPWKFGLATIYRRCMNTMVQALHPKLNIEMCFKETEKNLKYVLDNCTDQKDFYFKARSYIELADLYSTSNIFEQLIHTDKYVIIDLIYQGVQCLPDHTAILMKAGRLLRHNSRFQEAEALLQKAYDIRPNSYICHQLGLIQKNNLLYQQRKSQGHPKRYGGNKQNPKFGPRREIQNPYISGTKQNAVNTFGMKSKDPSIDNGSNKQRFRPLDRFPGDKVSKPNLPQSKSIQPTKSSSQLVTGQNPTSKPVQTIKTNTGAAADNDLEVDLAIGEPLSQYSFRNSPYPTNLKKQDHDTRGEALLDLEKPYSNIKLSDPLHPKLTSEKIFLREGKGMYPDVEQNANKDQQQDEGKVGSYNPYNKKSTEDHTMKRAESQTSISSQTPTESQTPTDSQTSIRSQAEDLAETFSKVSITNALENGNAGQETLSLAGSPSGVVSSGQSPSSEISPYAKPSPKFNLAKLINSPGKKTIDLELSKKLAPCIDLFRQSAELSHNRNLTVYYDWGLTLLQMTPTNFREVQEKFNYILDNDTSLFQRYRCYEQYGICKIRMSESPDIDEETKEDCLQDSVEMFRRAIRCWAYCQKIELNKHFDDAEGNCNSLRSIREIILGENSRDRTKPKKDMASLYFLVKQYGASLSLYQEVHDLLQQTPDTETDSDVIKGIINNHLQLHQFTGILDLLALVLCSKEGLKCLEFKTSVLKQMLLHSIDTHNYHISESVFIFEKDPNEECDHDVVIMFNDEDRNSQTIGANLKKWLNDFTNSNLTVAKSSETAANLPTFQEQVKLLCNSKMAIFLIADDNSSTEQTYLMNTALEAMSSKYYRLNKIFPLLMKDSNTPDIFKVFKSLKLRVEPNTDGGDEQDREEFLKTFSEIYLE